ncbi:MAG: hypothetical protein HGA45_14180 [Chloroflexales bacterium]|nr:hypothetical protein [Chloroflexales bacterium]
MTTQPYMLPAPGLWESRGSLPATPVWCEILPVTLRAQRVCHIRRGQDAASAAWQEPQIPGTHPSTLVRTRVEEVFGARLTPRRSVIHSTAWRYEPGSGADGRLVLTYLIVLPPWGGRKASDRAGPWDLEPVTTVAPARSAPLAPPERIALAHVLAHALDHLALLLETDPAIARALGRPWRQALAARVRRPAGERPPPLDQRLSA